MKVSIEIECDDIDDLKIHLSVIRSQILKRAKVLSTDDEADEKIMNFTDSNCYGSHEVKFTEL